MTMHENVQRLAELARPTCPDDHAEPLAAVPEALEMIARIGDASRDAYPRWWSTEAVSPRAALAELDVLASRARLSLVSSYGAPIRWATTPEPAASWVPVLLRGDGDAALEALDRGAWLSDSPWGVALHAYALESGWDFAPSPGNLEWAAVAVPDSVFLDVELDRGSRADVYAGSLVAVAAVAGAVLCHMWVARAYRRQRVATTLALELSVQAARGPFTTAGAAFLRRFEEELRG